MKRFTKVLPYPILVPYRPIYIKQDSKFGREQKRIGMMVTYKIKYGRLPPKGFPIRKWYKEYLKYHNKDDN